METIDLRERLIHALSALETTRPASFRAAFDFLAIFLSGAGKAHDKDLAAMFRRVIALIEDAEERERLEAAGRNRPDAR